MFVLSLYCEVCWNFHELLWPPQYKNCIVNGYIYHGKGRQTDSLRAKAEGSLCLLWPTKGVVGEPCLMKTIHFAKRSG